MAVVLLKLYGVDRELETKLKAKGVKDSEDLIALCQKNGGVDAVAADLGIDRETLSALVNRANLVRIRGIGEAYTMLLEGAGVKSVGDLAAKSPTELRSQLEQLNESHKVVGRVPALAMVNGWVNKAQKLPQG
jgi:predicted flap endonuclease-1-like 5' DNA nuclease